MTSLRQHDGAFAADIRGHVRGGKGPIAVVRGLLSGSIDHTTGEFVGRFEGQTRRKGIARATKLHVKGRLAATAILSAVVHVGDEAQGLDLGVPLIGRMAALRAERRPRPRVLKRKSGSKKTRSRRR
jgi:hypothetical protein